MLQYKVKLETPEKFPKIFLELRGFDEFDADILLCHGETVEEWIDEELVNAARQHVQHGYALHADYDADGVSSAMIAFIYDPRVRVIIPKRSWGYGLTEQSIALLTNERYIMTADCGIGNYREIDALINQGASVIVTDHHALPDRFPRCPIVHPQLLNHTGFTGYSGSSVLHKYLTAAYQRNDIFATQFACLGAIADVMPMVSENRIIVRDGLEYMRRVPDYRLESLFDALGRNVKYANVSDIGFYVAPAINACGRMDRIDVLYDWISSASYKAALSPSKMMAEVNQQRKLVVEKAIGEMSIVYDGDVIVAVIADSFLGVTGLIAGYLSRQYHKPAIACYRTDNTITGSVRWTGNYDALHMIDFMKKHYGFLGGGHKQAAGLKVQTQNLDPVFALVQAVEHYTAAYHIACDVDAKSVDFLIDIHDISQVANHVIDMEPYGERIKQPTFMCLVSLNDARVISKGKTCRIIISDVEFLLFDCAGLQATLEQCSYIYISFTINEIRNGKCVCFVNDVEEV